MEVTKIGQEQQLGQEIKTERRGTWFSLGIVGAVILITYLVFFGLYMARL
jgi:hypothetical protein